MKKGFLRLSLLAMASVLLSATALQAQPVQPITHEAHKKAVDNAALDFELVNDTGYDIAHLFVSPNEADDWQENILKKTLADGESVHVSFHPDEETAIWDMRADWDMEEGSEVQEYVYWYKLDFSKISTITLHYDADKDKTWATVE